ncbi:uroporphyrinogen-III C-methyltransferase [Rhabdothermincola sp.]|uniref:uroporphyrinogen-III C-methyltransferase n=1 Tax=Rhabdothermincola sp. TaxID=2820405 RepID=UPI002FE3967E
MTVYLVGAGPGDPGLLTVRGAELLARAEVVVYDRLSAPSLLELAPPTAELIDVGKTPGRATWSQAAICALLVDRGMTGALVVRLKGGDPFVFARGGEEAQALLDAGVPFEVVPGVSSAIAVPAYAGIPVTMRYSSTSFTVVTGHEDPSKASEVDWEAVARVGGTIVILMGVARLGAIVDRLLAGGVPGDTPAAAIRWGTRPDQHTVRATLATLTEHRLEPPATIVVGAVAGLDLTWFERRPLFGRRIVVTRARRQSPALVTRLRELGAEPIEVPVIDVVDPEDGGRALRAALARIAEYDWLVVTSPNGAARVLAAVRDARVLAPVRVAALGPGTAEALREGNVVADLVPEQFVAEALVDAFPRPTSDDHGRVLIARAAVARAVLPEGLAARGWSVDVVEAYRTVAIPVDDTRRAEVATADAITFTSSSTVERFVEALGVDAVPPMVVCIGPVTAATARACGLRVDAVASEHSIDGLVEALVYHAGRGR